MIILNLMPATKIVKIVQFSKNPSLEHSSGSLVTGDGMCNLQLHP